MRICLDLQGAQTESRFRGIGRYSLGFAQALARHAADSHDIRIVLNGSFAEPIESIRAAFADYLPADSVSVFDVPSPVAGMDAGNEWRARVAEKTREAFLSDLEPDLVHVSSMFEGWLDDAVTSLGAFEHHPTSATLYDLIPIRRRSDYAGDDRYLAFYERKLAQMKRAELLLAISDSARQEAIDLLDVSPDRVVAVGCGIDHWFTVAEHVVPSTPPSSDLISRSYILYAGGFDPRKNVARLVDAYGRLPEEVRVKFDLVIGGRITDRDKSLLSAVAAKMNLPAEALRFTGEIDDPDLASLYRHCAVFVYPSLHEGFGLPAAEAMACGAPVIASSTSSLPEVIGRADALFNPESADAIAERMTQVLSDQAFRAALKTHGVARAQQFTWDACARRALPAFEALHERIRGRARPRVAGRVPRLAFVSPLPPERTGIADYSAELLPALAAHYDIDVVVDQDAVQNAWINANLRVRTIDWFDTHATEFDRVLYHVGNSPFHRRIIEVAGRHAGTIVLHDFYMTGLLRWMEEHGGDPMALRRALYHSHGYTPLLEEKSHGTQAICVNYPANLAVIESAGGVIVHSHHAVALARHWYGEAAARELATVPLCAVAPQALDRVEARAALGIAPEAFLVCSFGFLAPTKLNDRLLAAWVEAGLVADQKALLVFVGENEGGEYGRRIAGEIAALDGGMRIRITGYASAEDYEHYIAAADVAVQTRAGTRGESSWAVLRCLASGVPTIANAHGAAAEYPDDVVWQLPDEFTVQELAQALVTLRGSPKRMAELRQAALDYVAREHAPRVVAARYHAAIERFAERNARLREQRLIRDIAGNVPRPPADSDIRRIAAVIARQAVLPGQRQLLVDVTVVARHDLRTGIERVVRGVLMELLRAPPPGFRVEPVHDDGSARYLYARDYAMRALELPEGVLREEAVEAYPGDVFLGLDWYADGVPRLDAQLRDWRNRGVKIHFVVYDLLPVLLPDAFPPSSRPIIEGWLRTIARLADGVVCISRSVADQFMDWLEAEQPGRARTLQVGYFPLGSTLADTLPTTTAAADSAATPPRAGARPAFLMVGTVEPRKAHREVLAAFERLWQSGTDADLVIVGKEGWMLDAFAKTLRSHPERGARLHWLENASDELLEHLYGSCSALIAASHGEGFGLPIVEAARHGLPVLARDIPVFREVAGEHVTYFTDDEAGALAAALDRWLSDRRDGKTPDPRGIEVFNWRTSAERLCAVVLGNAWYRAWSPGNLRRSREDTPRMPAFAAGHRVTNVAATT